MEFLFLSFLLLLLARPSFSNDEELLRLVDYWRSFSRENDSSLLGEDLMSSSTVWLPQVPRQSLSYKWSLENKAAPDECFFGPDEPSTRGACPSGSTGTNKTNQAFVFSAVKSGQNIFWGTVANYVCVSSRALLLALGQVGSLYTPDLFCNNGFTGVTPNDYRPPEIYLRRDSDPIGTQTRISDRIPNTMASQFAQTFFNQTLGIRASGVTHNGVAIFGGPNILGVALNLFTFNAATGTYLAWSTFASFNDIRKIATIDGQTYLGVFGSGGIGYLLRYKGSLTNSLSLQVVAKLAGNPAEVTQYDSKRLLISTWAMPTPTSSTPYGSGRLILSPPMSDLPDLASASDIAAISKLDFTEGFTVVWDAVDYEPDPLTAYTLGASVAAQGSDGWFYWGTFQYPIEPLGYFFLNYKPDMDNFDPTDILKIFLGTHRPSSVFRGRAFDSSPEVELLYGERYFPVYDNTSGKWSAKPNKLGVTPKYGRSGFGNVANVYIWSADTYKGDVLLGTFDESYLFATFLQNLIPNQDPNNLRDIFGFESIEPGADLYVFRNHRIPFLNTYNPARRITLSGLDNKINYGIRDIVHDPASPDEDRWVGTANPFNLNPEGGWELYRLARIPQPEMLPNVH